MSKTVITINKSKTSHAFGGIGVQWDPFNIFPLTESEWDRVVRRVGFLSPAFVRLMIYAPTYCRGLDKDGRPVYDFDCPAVKDLLDELDYLESRRVGVILGEWEHPEGSEDLSMALQPTTPSGLRQSADCSIFLSTSVAIPA